MSARRRLLVAVICVTSAAWAGSIVVGQPAATEVQKAPPSPTPIPRPRTVPPSQPPRPIPRPVPQSPPRPAPRSIDNPILKIKKQQAAQLEVLQKNCLSALSVGGLQVRSIEPGRIEIKDKDATYEFTFSMEDLKLFRITAANVFPLTSEAARTDAIAAARYATDGAKCTRVVVGGSSVSVVTDLCLPGPEWIRSVITPALGYLESARAHFVKRMNKAE